MTTPLRKYLFKLDCGKPTHAGMVPDEHGDWIKAADVEPVHKAMREFLEKYIRGQERWSFGIQEAQVLLKALEGKGVPDE